MTWRPPHGRGHQYHPRAADESLRTAIRRCHRNTGSAKRPCWIDGAAPGTARQGPDQYRRSSPSQARNPWEGLRPVTRRCSRESAVVGARRCTQRTEGLRLPTVVAARLGRDPAYLPSVLGWTCPDFVDTWVKLLMLRDPTVARRPG